MRSISFKKHEMEIVHFLIQSRSFNSWKLFLFSVKGVPPTPQHSASHPCTSPTLGGHDVFCLPSVWHFTLRLDCARSERLHATLGGDYFALCALPECNAHNRLHVGLAFIDLVGVFQNCMQFNGLLQLLQSSLCSICVY